MTDLSRCRRLLWVFVAAFVVASLSACGVHRSDDARTDVIQVDGHTCAVARDGLGRVIAIDCDWSEP